MSNDFFNHSSNRISDGTTARATQVNSIADEIATGLDKLPTEAHLKRGKINYATATAASANTYTATLPYTPTAYEDGMEMVVKFPTANTGAATINPNSLGAKSIVRQDETDLQANDLAGIVPLRYNATLGKFMTMNAIQGPAALSALMSSLNTSADAAVAMDVLSGLQHINGITSLKGINPVAGRVVYLKYHTDQGDGGHGVFEALTTGGPYTDDDGVTIVPTGGDGSAAWQRKLEGFVTPEMFGAVGDGTTDDTTAIQAAINFSRNQGDLITTAGGVIVIFDAKNYAATKITRKSGVALIGRGSRSTFFTALSHTETDPYGFFEIEDGPVVSSPMKGFRVNGGTNANQWGMYIHAKWDTGYVQGGLWLSEHEDVELNGFNYGLWSRGGYTMAHSQRPNQFLKFINCVIQVPAGGESVRLTGQHGQIEFTGGDCAGLSGVIASRCLTVDWDPDPSTTADNASGVESTADVSGVGSAVRTGENIIFSNGASLQRSDLAVYVRNAYSVIINGCWIESIGKGFQAETNGTIHVSNSHLANVGNGSYLTVSSPGSGWMMSVGTGAGVVIEDNNNVVGTTDNYVISTQNVSTTDKMSVAGVNRSTLGKTNVTTPNTKTISSGGDLSIAGNKIVYVAPYASDKSVALDTIDSDLGPGEEIVLFAYTESFTITNSGNIRPPSTRTNLTVGNRTHVTLKRVWGFGGFEWHVTHFEDEYASALPSSGEYYAVGTRIWSTAPAAGGSPGWVCTTAGLAGSTAVFKAMANLAA